MAPESPSPTNRPVGAFRVETEVPGGVEIPWIDIHQHTQSLTWNDREKFDLSGGQAIVMIAASYYWTPYRPVAADDVRFLWDDALRRANGFSHSHFYDQYVAIGIHTWSRVEDAEELIAVLPEYCDLDEVVAIGETGIESTQHTSRWDLAGQKTVVREQMRVAKEKRLPVIVHTPGSNKGGMPATFKDNYEEHNRNFTDPLLDPETAKRDATEIDVELKDDAGLPDEQVIVDHADASIVPYVMENTDCYLAFSVSAPWLRNVDARDVAETIHEYGPDRVIVDTDMIGAMQNDVFAMKRTIFDLLRLGVEREDVRKVVYENPKDVLNLSLAE